MPGFEPNVLGKVRLQQAAQIVFSDETWKVGSAATVRACVRACVRICRFLYFSALTRIDRRRLRLWKHFNDSRRSVLLGRHVTALGAGQK
jgi:hypothetical protein